MTRWTVATALPTGWFTFKVQLSVINLIYSLWEVRRRKNKLRDFQWLGLLVLPIKPLSRLGTNPLKLVRQKKSEDYFHLWKSYKVIMWLVLTSERPPDKWHLEGSTKYDISKNIGRWRQLKDQFPNYMKMKIAVHILCLRTAIFIFI